jgi:hypothetical protein
MQIILLSTDGDPIALDVPDESDTDLLYQLVAAEINVSPNHFILLFNNVPLAIGQMLLQLGILDGATVIIEIMKRQKVPSIYELPVNTPPEKLLELTIAHPELLRQFRDNDPELGELLGTQDLAKIRMFLMKRFMNHHQQEYSKEQDIRALEADPMNPELQKKIEEAVSIFPYI